MDRFLMVFKERNDKGLTGKLKNTVVQFETKEKEETFIDLMIDKTKDPVLVSVYNLDQKTYVFKERSNDIKANVPNAVTQPPTVYNRTVGLGPYA